MRRPRVRVDVRLDGVITRDAGQHGVSQQCSSATLSGHEMAQ